MMPTLASPSDRPYPVVYYTRRLVVNGQPVRATVTNLTADFLERLRPDPHGPVVP